MEGTTVFQGIFENMIYEQVMKRLQGLNWETIDNKDLITFYEEWLFEKVPEVLHDEMCEFLVSQGFAKKADQRGRLVWQVPYPPVSDLTTKIIESFSRSYETWFSYVSEAANNLVERFVASNLLHKYYQVTPTMMRLMTEHVASYNRMVIRLNNTSGADFPYVHIATTKLRIYLAKSQEYLEEGNDNYYFRSVSEIVKVFDDIVRMYATSKVYVLDKVKMLLNPNYYEGVAETLAKEGYCVSRIPMRPEQQYEEYRGDGTAPLYVEVPDIKKIILEEETKLNALYLKKD